MNIIVAKEGSVLRIVESSDPIPDGTRLVLQPRLEVSSLEALELAQLENLGREQEEDWRNLLDPLSLPPGQMPSVTAAR